MSSRTVLAAVGVLMIGVVEVGSVIALAPFGEASATMAYIVGLAVALSALGVFVMGLDPSSKPQPGSDGDGGPEPDPRPRDPQPPGEPTWWDVFEREFRDYADRPAPAPSSTRERELVGVE